MEQTSIFTRIKRFFLALWWIISLTCSCYLLYPFISEKQRQEKTRRAASRILNYLHINIEKNGDFPPDMQGVLVVSNHVSWLDILVLLHLAPVSFVAKQEIRSWIVIGKVAQSINTIFVNREQRRDSAMIAKIMAQRLTSQQNIIFFPEARTSADGLHVLPFKASLFQAAIDSSSPVQTVAIRYYDNKNKRTTVPAYMQNVNLIKSFLNVVRLPETVVRADILSIIIPTDEGNRFLLKEMTQNLITQQVENDLN